MTPYQLNLIVEEYDKRKVEESKGQIYQAYLISRWVWQKKVDIKKILNPGKKDKVMTDEQMLEQVRFLNRLFGGEEVNQ